VGGDGRFYLESLPPGRHEARVDWSGGRCRASIAVPASPSVVDVGRVRCDSDPVPVIVKAAPEPAPAGATAKEPTAAEATSTSSATSTSTASPTDTTGSRSDRVALVGPPRDPEEAAREPTSGPSVAVGKVAILSSPPPAGADAPPRLPDEPPPPGGYGPRTPRCPSCAVCLSAALNKLSTPTAQARCVADLTIMQPSLGRKGAVNACLLKPDFDELCAECVQMRTVRRCPTWPKKAPPGSGPRSAAPVPDAATMFSEWLHGELDRAAAEPPQASRPQGRRPVRRFAPERPLDRPRPRT
jgi:hypothetical protein